MVHVAGDLALHVEARGSGEATLLLHGFTESGRAWNPLVAALRGSLHTVTVDLIGHGRSGAPDDAARYAMERVPGDLCSVLDALGIARAHLVGYSLGGRVALRTVLDAPGRVGALILVSASAGIADPAERRMRRTSDLAFAERIEREGTRRFVDEWESLELFASERALPAARRAALRRERLAQRPRGLANSLHGMGQGAMEPLWDRLGEIRAPVLVVTGAQDARYGALAADLVSRIAGARHVALPETGHAVHRERPPELAALIAEFLRAAPAARAIATEITTTTEARI
ncbi:MAG TPA: 2-succinyl-6-hydroxy-2,4-cyclohexadiene-1-carboxylate synthase [Candidatus Limnocylindria bacterium]|nr:2-succinyl-6-hydroxy-2,4-cyclohexadiene-1-carboxylate synthase [Candidatus Limnocylindria bacterium]